LNQHVIVYTCLAEVVRDYLKKFDIDFNSPYF